MAFKKGQSGNPGGRPKEDNDDKQLAREHSEEALQRLLTWMRSENPKASVAACQAVLDRAYGKPAQALIGGDENDPPLKIQQVKRVIVRAQS
jgi:hypothetical protein